MDKIYLERTRHLDADNCCPKCDHYEKEEGAILSDQWGQCQFNKENEGRNLSQIDYAPMVHNEITCNRFKNHSDES